MREFPSLFVSHGAPTLLIEASPTRDFLAGLGGRLGLPKAILCVSAHWESAQPLVTGAAQPATIHDFYGFPRALYETHYPAPGDPALAQQVVGLLADAGLRAQVDMDRGFDHGVWVPLALIYPSARIPVVQLSVQPARGAAHHVAVGRALAPLRERGVLILGSGSLTHNLAELRPPARRAGSDRAVAAWADAFDRWTDGVLAAGDLDALARYRSEAPEAARAHPTDEHLLPLHVAAAAGGGPGRRLHGDFMFGSLSMAAYAFPALPDRGPAPEDSDSARR